MAYKFQLGAARLGGSVSADGLDAQDKDISNIQTASADVFAADGDDFVLQVNNNRAAGLIISGSGQDKYLTVNTAGGVTQFGKNSLYDGSNGISFRSGGDQTISSTAVDTLELAASASMNFAINVGNPGGGVKSIMTLTDHRYENYQLHLSGTSELRYDVSQMTGGKFLVSNGTQFKSVAMGGDASLASNGTLTIANDTIGMAQLKSSEFARGDLIRGNASGDPELHPLGAANRVLQSDGTDLVYDVVANAALANSSLTVAAGDGLKTGGSVSLGSSVTLDIDVSDFAGTGLEDDGSENLRLSAQGTGIAGGAGSTLSVAAAQTSITSILNDSLKIGRADGNDAIDFGTDDAIDFFIDGTSAADLEMRIASGSVTIMNNLRVLGTTTTVDSTTINITGSLVFEGTTSDANDTTLGVVDPTANRSILLPNAAGNLAVFSDSSFQTNAATVTVTELNLLDKGTAIGSSVTIADADGIILHNADGNMEKVPASDLKTYLATSSKLSVDDAVADGDTLIYGFNVVSAMGSDGTDVFNLPSCGASDVGKRVIVKASTDCSATRIARITPAGSDKVDGIAGQTLDLVSPDAAVTLVCTKADEWHVM